MDDDEVESRSPTVRRQARRAILRGALAIGVGFPLLEMCAGLAPEAGAQGDPRNQRPQNGDRFAFQAGERIGQVITVADLPVGGPPVVAYPMDPASGVVRDGSRLNQILLVRLRRRRALGGDTGPLRRRCRGLLGRVHAHGVRHHASGKPRCARFRCPCHESEFDPKDAGRVVGGPAPRRLPRAARESRRRRAVRRRRLPGPARVSDRVSRGAGGVSASPTRQGGQRP